MRATSWKRWLAILLTLILLCGDLGAISGLAEQIQAQRYQLVLTLGADLSTEQKSNILKYFGIGEDQATVVTITNQNEREQLGNLVSAEVIGTRTLSCALIRLTTSGGIQVKTANMNFVTSNMIASTLSTSGVYNCEVLTAAPFEVSGTGALTGVMMAYEAGTGQALDPEKKNLANEELVITGEIANNVGQDQATLVVNDIKIHIVRDNIKQQQEVVDVVDEVIETTETAAAKAAEAQGKAAPAKLGTVETERLYDFGYKFSQMGYNYADMQPTLERVTRNITKSTGIQDPITDTFTTTDDEAGLSIDSILLNTDDSVFGNDAIINATNTVALGDHPAEIIEVYTGDVRLTEAGKVKAESFIRGSNVVAFKDVNGKYALMDLNGNILTESIYTNDFRSRAGLITAKLADESGLAGVLNTDGKTVVPFQYDVVDVLGELWGVGIHLTLATEDDYDYFGFGSSDKYKIETADIYYFQSESTTPVASLSREAYGEGYAFGDYLNLRDRNGVVTTYDPSFHAVQNPTSLYDSTFDEAYRAAQLLSSQMNASIRRFSGNYAAITQNGKSGVVDRYGNLIVPIEFDAISSANDESFVSGGYVAAEQNGQFVYVVQGGTVTARYPVSHYDVYNYGMAAYRKGDDGSYTLYSGDGVMTELGTTYSYLSAITESKGLLWKCELPDYKYDLIDWHGNVLLSGCDDYSVSANGNYVIAQDGYTSSTLYMVNDASPVTLAESAGGAIELTAEVQEGASLEAYTGEPTLELLGEIPVAGFVEGTQLMIAWDSSTDHYMIVDINGRPLTEAIYERDIEYKNGWLIVQQEVDGKLCSGLLSITGAQVLPCVYNTINVLNKNWVVAYMLTPTATKDDYDFRGWGANYEDIYYYIESAQISHLTESEISSVTLTREQIADVAAEEDYLNVQDRATGAVTTYDSSFTAVATVNSTYNFSGFSTHDVLEKTIRDQTGYSIFDNNFPDGYARVCDYSSEDTLMGVVDMSGNIVVPVVYDKVETSYNFESHVWGNGYFCVEKDEKFGYVTQGGNVTCALENSTEEYNNAGMSASVKQTDGTYSLIAADGVVTDGFSRLRQLYGGFGMFWLAENPSDYSYDLLDWHGNLLFENVSSADVCSDGQYLLVERDYGEPMQLYAVDGAHPEGGFVETEAQEEAAPAESDLPPEEKNIETTPAPTEAPTAAPKQEAADVPTDTPVPDAETETAGNTGNASAAMGLIASAQSLIAADLATNRTAIITLLDQAKAILDAENPDIAGLVGSAITLLSSDTTESTAVTTLLDTAVAMMG